MIAERAKTVGVAVSWNRGPPIRLADTPMSDCGYPSTVQLAENRFVTAYYTQLPGQYQYEMRTVLWDDQELG